MLDQRSISGVVQPGVPFGWHHRGFRRAGIDHPAAQTITGARTPLLIVNVAERIGADALSLEQRKQPGTEIHAGGYTKLREPGPPGLLIHRILWSGDYLNPKCAFRVAEGGIAYAHEGEPDLAGRAHAARDDWGGSGCATASGDAACSLGG